MNDIKIFGDKARATQPGDLFIAEKASIEGHDIATLKRVVPTDKKSLYDISTDLQYLIFKGNLPENTLRQLHKIAFDKMALEIDEG